MHPFLSCLQVRQKPPAGRSSRQQPAGSSSSGGGSSSNSVSGGGGSSGASSSSSSARASPAGTIRAPTGHHGRPALASNFSLDDITAQLERVCTENVCYYKIFFWRYTLNMFIPKCSLRTVDDSKPCSYSPLHNNGYKKYRISAKARPSVHCSVSLCCAFLSSHLM